MNRRGLLCLGGVALAATGCTDPRKYLDPRVSPSPGVPPKLPGAETRLLERAAFGPSGKDSTTISSTLWAVLPSKAK